jgi:hypothetical protein
MRARQSPALLGTALWQMLLFARALPAASRGGHGSGGGSGGGSAVEYHFATTGTCPHLGGGCHPIGDAVTCDTAASDLGAPAQPRAP